MTFYWMTTDGYSICRGNGCDIKRNARKLERLTSGTVSCDECGRYIPAKGRGYKPTVTETMMSERGLIQDRDSRPTVEERRAFRLMLKNRFPDNGAR